MNNCCQKVIPLTTEGERLTKILMILFFIDLALMIVKIVFKRYDSLFSMLISLVLLLATFLMCHYYLAMFLVFFICFDAFYSLIFLAQRLQNWIVELSDIYVTDKFYKIAVWIEFAYFVFLIVLIIFVFKAYKEYKAISLGNLGDGLTGMFGNYNPLRQDDTEENTNNNNVNGTSSNNGNYKPFSGKGTPVGGN